MLSHVYEFHVQRRIEFNCIQNIFVGELYVHLYTQHVISFSSFGATANDTFFRRMLVHVHPQICDSESPARL